MSSLTLPLIFCQRKNLDPGSKVHDFYFRDLDLRLNNYRSGTLISIYRVNFSFLYTALDPTPAQLR